MINLIIILALEYQSKIKLITLSSQYYTNKLTFVLSEIEDLEASIEVGLSIISRFLDTIQPQDEMSSISRYWIARSMFLLCDNLIKTNSPEEAKKIYRMMIAYKLPGQELVKQFLSKL